MPSEKLGLVGDSFSQRDVIERLTGANAIGHVRYSTTGENGDGATSSRCSPSSDAGGFAVAHNGNLTNGLTLAPGG